MKMPMVGALPLITRFDVLVQPFSRFSYGLDSMGLAPRESNHRNYQEDKGCDFEKSAAQRAAGDKTDRVEQNLTNKKNYVES